MNKLPLDVTEKFKDVLRENITILEFENWIYQSSEILQSFLSENDYFELISLNYKKTTLSSIAKLVSKHLDFSELETCRILSLLNKIKNKNGDLRNIIQLIYIEYQKNDYHFLDQFLEFQFFYYPYYKVSNYWKNLSENEKEIVFEYNKIVLNKITDFYINCLESGKIKIISRFNNDFVNADIEVYESDEQNNIDYAFVDNRSEEEKNRISSFPIDEFINYIQK